MNEEQLSKAIKRVMDQKDICWSYIEKPFLNLRRVYLRPGNVDAVHLLKTLREQNDLQRFNSRAFIMPNSTELVSFTALASWIIDHSCQKGVDATIDALKRYLALDFTPTVEILAITGIEIEEQIELDCGINLAPIDDVPFASIQEALTKKIIGPEAHPTPHYSPLAVWMEDRKPPTAVFYCFTEMRPQTCDPQNVADIKFCPRFHDLHEVCALLALIGPSAPMPLVYWSEVEEWVPLSNYVGNAYSYEYSEGSCSSPHHFSKRDLQEAKSLHTQLLKCSPDIRTKIRIPLERLAQAISHRNPVDKAIDLGIALESLLLNDIGSNEQLSLGLRMRGAWLLGSDAENRHRLTRIFKKLYELRSQAAHGGKFTKDRIKIDSESIPIQDFLHFGEEFCAAIIKKVLERTEFPEWGRLIVGDRF